MRINSPEQIHDYIRVTNPGIWLILSAIIIFLLGLFTWIFTGTLEISFKSIIYRDGGKFYSSLTQDKFTRLKVGMPVRVSSNITGEIINLSRDSKQYQAEIKFSGLNPEDTAQGIFIIDTVKPIKFLLR